MSLDQVAQPTLGDKLQSVPKPLLYLLLVLATAVPLFFDIKLPNKPTDAAIDLYTSIMAIPEGKTVLVSTEWTNGTRAESRGEFEALMRMLMHRKLKFVIYSIGDNQAPPVAKDVIRDLNVERVANNEKPYERWNDWVEIGFYANGEGTVEALAVSVKKAFAGKKDLNLVGENEDVFDSPVLKGVSTLNDIGAVVDVTASATDRTYIQRLPPKTMLLEFCTGVMGPEAFNYYASGQVKGLAAGLKGVLDMETLMVDGVNIKDADGNVAISSSRGSEPVPGFMDPKFKGKGYSYYPALHVAMALLIIAIIVGNIGMFMAKGNRAK